MSITPPNRPNITSEMILTWVPSLVDSHKVTLVGRRGYYGDSMGRPGSNDLGIYDDAICLIHPDWTIETFNANTDPAKLYKNVARLEPGSWTYKVGIHNQTKSKEQQYTALVQASSVTVFREGTEGVVKGVADERGRCLGHGLWSGWFGINIHRGGYFGVSSAGCQTIFPDQWPFFIRSVQQLLSTNGQSTLQYVLTSRY